MVTNSRAQSGLSLIELMISITIGLLILVSLTTLFVNQSHTRAELDKSTRMIENGRYSMELMNENLRLAGFYGELNSSGLALPGAITDPCSTDSALMTAMLPLYVTGYNVNSSTATIASPPCGLATTDVKAGSDILVLRRAETTPPISQAWAVANNTVAHYLQVSLCGFDAANSFVISTAPANFTLRQRNCSLGSTTPYANLRRYLVQTYYISPNNNAGDGIPTLMRKEINATGGISTTPLVEGIEYLQVEYGIDDPAVDSDGNGTVGQDGIADSYISCAPCTIAQWSQVVSVKLYIIARNIEQSTNFTGNIDKSYTLGLAGTFGPFNDTFKRQIYTQVVRLVNPSSRRELP